MDKIERAIFREEVIAECIAAMSVRMDVDGDPGPVAFDMLDAVKALRSPEPVRIAYVKPVDYLEAVQDQARAAWGEKFKAGETGPASSAMATVMTPLGPLRCTTWQREWAGPKRQRVTWASHYDLKNEAVTIATIRAAGLADRPSKRNRAKGK